jgi:UDP-GlcNAc3NAcA epimerase
MIEPVGYLEMLYLIMKCSFVMPDSGGLQKEAFFFRKFCLTLRDEIEWIELLENGFSFIAGVSWKKFCKDTNCLFHQILISILIFMAMEQLHKLL